MSFAARNSLINARLIKTYVMYVCMYEVLSIPTKSFSKPFFLISNALAHAYIHTVHVYSSVSTNIEKSICTKYSVRSLKPVGRTATPRPETSAAPPYTEQQ